MVYKKVIPYFNGRKFLITMQCTFTYMRRSIELIDRNNHNRIYLKILSHYNLQANTVI